MITAVISRYGDRKREPQGCVIDKVGMNVYQLVVEPGPRPFVFVETVTPNRVAVVDRGLTGLVFDIRTFNTLNGYHPGSDLKVRVYREGEPDLLSSIVLDEKGKVGGSGDSAAPTWRDGLKTIVQPRDPGSLVLVQAHGRTVQHLVVEQVEGKVSIETLITRTPATPLETNIEIAVVRNLGPIRGR